MEFLSRLFDPKGFPARWQCGAGWAETPWLGWLHIFSDLGVWSAYLAIPLVLIYFLYRRQDLPFRRVFLLFGAFILACGTTHLVEAIIFWWPIYRVAGVIKLFTAIISWATVIALIRVVPRVMTMRTPEELEREIAGRKLAEADLQRANDELERRVQERTNDLTEVVATLKEERELLRTTLKSIGDGVIVTDSGAKVTFLNGVAELLTGWKNDEAMGEPLEKIFNIVNEETRKTVENPATRSLESGTIVGLANHTVLLSKDGTERPIEDSASPIRGESGTIRGAVLVFRDVADRRKQEKDLRGREQEFRNLAESIPQLCWMAQTDGHIYWYNRRWYEYTGTTFEQMEGWGWQSVHDASELPMVLEKWADSIATGKPFEMVFPLRSREGVFRRFLTRVIPIHDDDGKIVRWFGTNTDIHEVHRIEEELRERERFIHHILDATPSLVYVFDLELGTIFINQRVEATLGITPAEVVALGKEFMSRYVHPEDSPTLEDYLGRLAVSLTDEPFSTEYRLRTVDDQWRWFSSRDVVFSRSPEGAPTQTLGVATDITDQKRAESERQKFETLVEQTSDFIAMATLDGKTVYLNPAGAELVGLDSQVAILSSQIPDYFPVEFQRLFAEVVLPIVMETGHWEGDVLFRHFKTGRLISMMQSIFLIRQTTTGEPILIATVARDITDGNLAEERWRLALDSADMGAWKVDTATNLLETDERFRAIFGVSGDHLTYEDAFAIIHEDDRQLVRDAVAAATRLIDPVPYIAEYRVVHPDGSIHWVYARGRANFESSSDGRRLVSFDGTVLDMTERKQLEESLRGYADEMAEAARNKDEFLATLAHELRNPLAPIRNSLEVMGRAKGDLALFEDSRSTMARQLGHMVRLIDDLLDVSRINRNKLELLKQQVELASVIHHSVEACRPLAEAENIRLEVAVPAEPIYLHADGVRLAQVFGNMLTNAVKYSEPGGNIRLSVETQDSTVEVRVKDSGIGIAPDKIDQVFEMFTQIDRTMDRTKGGLGIGLSLVKRLVELHDGTVTANSEGRGKGSEFVVRLPILTEVPERPEPPKGTEDKPHATGQRILIVDDNLDAASTLAMLLEITGNEVRTAHDGLTAVEQAESYKPDVMLLDIGLPKLDGYGVCRAIRKEPWGQAIVIVALTGWGQEEDRRKTKEAGFDGHLVKPVDHEDLAATLAELRRQ